MRRHTDYENMVAAYHLLSSAEHKELNEHLRECAVCAADLAAYRQMDADLRGLRPHHASVATAARVFDAISAAGTVQVPARDVARSTGKEPAIRQPERARRPWTWSRLLLPAGFALLFVIAVALSLPRGGGDEGVVEPQPVAAPPEQAAIVKLTFSCDEVSAFLPYGAWAKALQAFEAENPDVQVDLRPSVIAVTEQTTYQEAVADGAARFDVFCFMPTLSDLHRGIVTDLAPYIANDPSFRPDDFYPGLLKTSEQDGVVLSIPTYFRPALIGYRPELFDAAGVSYPWPGWGWNDFLATAKALTRRNGAEVTQWGYYEVGGLLFSSRLQSGWSRDRQTPPDYATTAEILRWYEKLYAREPAAGVPASLKQEAGERYNNRVMERMLNDGKVAMTDASWSDDRGKLHFAAYPGSSSGFYVGRVSDMVMSGQTAHPNEAWRLISYLSQHLPDGEVPARRSLAAKASFWTHLDESSTAAYVYALDQVEAGYAQFPPDYEQYQTAAIAVAKGEKTAEQALAELDAQVQLRGGPVKRAMEERSAVATASAPGAMPQILTPTPPAADAQAAAVLAQAKTAVAESFIVQNDGESLEEFLARIAMTKLDDYPHDALIVESVVENRKNLYMGVSTKEAKRCWISHVQGLKPCEEPAGEDVAAILNARPIEQPVIYFAVANGNANEKIVLYDIHNQNNPDDTVDGYRIVVRLRDGKWREGARQQVY